MLNKYLRPLYAPEGGTGGGTGGEGGQGGSGGGTGGAGGAGDTPAWHVGVEAETLGFWQNKGYKVDDPKALASELTKQYRQLESHLGAPPDQLLRMPKADAKPEELRAFRERLGAPKEAKEYDVSAVKDETIAESLRAAAHATGLPKDAAASMASAVAKALESKTAAEAAINTGKLAEEKATLARNWGTKYDFNHLKAMEGAARLGITPEAVKALEGQIGYAAVMEAMRKIGSATSEDTFVERGAGGAAGPPTTREGAMSRKAELMGDPAWCKRYTSGDVTARQEMSGLNMMIDGEARAA